MPKEEKQEPSYDDIEVFDFSLSEDDIEDLMKKLKVLKKTKTTFSFQVDDKNEFVIHYAGYEDAGLNKKDLAEETDERFYEKPEEGE
jgi:hypothetical protein